MAPVACFYTLVQNLVTLNEEMGDWVDVDLHISLLTKQTHKYDFSNNISDI